MINVRVIDPFDFEDSNSLLTSFEKKLEKFVRNAMNAGRKLKRALAPPSPPSHAPTNTGKLIATASKSRDSALTSSIPKQNRRKYYLECGENKS